MQNCIGHGPRISSLEETENNADDIMNAVVNTGPVVVTINIPEGFFVRHDDGFDVLNIVFVDLVRSIQGVFGIVQPGH